MAVNFRYSTKPNATNVPVPDIYWEVDFGIVTDDGAGNDQDPPVSGNKVKRWTSKDATRHIMQQTTDASRPTYYY